MKKGGSVLRPATPADYPSIAALLDRTFGGKPYEQRLKLWKWRYDDNPARTDAFPSFLVLEQEHRIVGVQGLFPLRIKVGQKNLTASVSCDLAVDPAARSEGVKLKLGALSKDLSSLHISTSSNETANKITLALGGREVFPGRRKYLKPLRVSGLLRKRLPETNTVAGKIAAASLAVAKPVDCFMAIERKFRLRSRRQGIAIRDVPRFDERFEKFWGELSKENVILVVRDRSYLNWRYSEYPFAGIQSFELLLGQELFGFSVIHMGVDNEHLCFATILELAGRDCEMNIEEHLLKEGIRRAAMRGAHYVTARAPTTRSRELLRRYGFHPRDLHYSPITYRNTSNLPDDVFAKNQNWYLSMGDGDICHYFDTRS